MIFLNKRILVVVAHPDDELLGIGATIHHLSHNKNCRIRAVILGEGLTSRADNRDRRKWEKALKTHRENIEMARKIVGYESVGIYDFPDNRFDTIPLLDLIKVVEREKESFKPDVIFTHHGGDVNIDHQKVFQSVITATRPMEEESVNAVITFETPSGTEWIPISDPRRFLPNLFIEVNEDDVKAKIKGMECYEFERRDYPHPRSPEALNTYAKQRGITVGKRYVEAFCIIRLII